MLRNARAASTTGFLWPELKFRLHITSRSKVLLRSGREAKLEDASREPEMKEGSKARAYLSNLELHAGWTAS